MTISTLSPATATATAAVEGGGQEDGLPSGVLGTSAITFMVLAVAAPMAVIVATMPLAFALGNGSGVAGTYLLVAITMALFAMGYVRLLPHVRNAGAFYAIVTLSFGRESGLGAAYVALSCYVALCSATIGVFSFFLSDFVEQNAGAHVHWIVFALATIAALAALSFYRITLAARILEIALTAEVVAILILDLAIVFGHHGPMTLTAFTPHAVLAPGIGITAIYGFNSCVGFEGTAIYQEEAKDRERSIPRATYAAIGIVGIFYVFTAWCMSIGAGGDPTVVAAKDPGHFVFLLARMHLGAAGETVLSLLVVSSAFAAVLGLFNNSARYCYALARDGVVPQFAAHVHPVSGSPFNAGILILILMTVIVSLFAIGGGDPLLMLATSLTGLGSLGLMGLLAVTAFAIPVYFVREGHSVPRFKAIVAPTIGAILISIGVVLSLRNYAALTGSTSPWVNRLPWVLIGLMLAGIGQALWLRRAAPATYLRIGSSRVED